MLLSGISVYAADLTYEEQLEIIRDYAYVSGQINDNNSAAFDKLSADVPVKCGTPAVVRFQDNYDKLDKMMLKSLGVMLQTRPGPMSDTLDSPGGHFRIHYTTTGPDAIYSGIPGYVDSLAAIFDHVYDYMINDLGYPAPPSDGDYNGGGDGRYDIYVLDFNVSAYGLTYKDSIFEAPSLQATAFMEFENDFQEIDAYKVQGDPYRPLDAARVTAAHEFFHFVHFGMDHTETQQVLTKVVGSAWLEMSAVWMEEEIYDDVNDYYYYLPTFFAQPWASIAQFWTESDLHPYASVVYPLYLTQKYDRDVIRAVWEHCVLLGSGPDYLEALEDVIDSVGTSTNFAHSFAEFAIWNYFTGSRANLAPEGYSYEEASFYDQFRPNKSDSEMFVIDSYQDTTLVFFNENYLNPYHNGAFYMSLRELQTIGYDTTYWNCNAGSFPSCTDSTLVTDTTLGYEKMHVDSTLEVQFGLDSAFPHNWGVGIIFNFEEYLDSTEVTYGFLVPEPGKFTVLQFANPREYRSITIVITPASSIYSEYLTVPPQLDVDPRYEILFRIPKEPLVIDSTLANLPAEILHPYPNPAVVARMTEPVVKFKLQVPTDSVTMPLYGDIYSGSEPYMVVDLFNVAGEKVATVDQFVEIDDRFGTYVVSWDMKNSGGEDIASGVYVAYARFYSDAKKTNLLVETTTKVAVIR